MSDHKIEKRDDISPKEGEHKYGQVEFADPVNKKYPIDDAEHVRAAWSYINHPANAAKYHDKGDIAQIKERIKKAAHQYGVEIKDE